MMTNREKFKEVLEVKIGYVDPKYDIRYDMGPLRDAVTWASHNLALRHRICLEGPYETADCVYVRLSGINFDDSFNVGNHLRGISSHLMKNHPYIKNYIYKPGKGLLYFIKKENNNED